MFTLSKAPNSVPFLGSYKSYPKALSACLNVVEETAGFTLSLWHFVGFEFATMKPVPSGDENIIFSGGPPYFHLH